MNATHTFELVGSLFQTDTECLTSDPYKLVNALELFSYALWSKHRVLLSAFLDQGGVERVLALLRPRYLERMYTETTPCVIPIHLHHGQAGATEVVECWPNAIRALASIVFAKLCRYQPTFILDNFILASQQTWVLDLFIKLLRSGSDFERYGALVALEACASHSDIRDQWLDHIDVVQSITELMDHVRNKEGNRKRPSVFAEVADGGEGLFGHLRWKMATWRASLHLLMVLTVAPGLSLYSDQDAKVSLKSSLYPVRHHWYNLLVKKCHVVDSLLGILTYCLNAASQQRSIRSPLETVFSGPGVFHGSALRMEDLSPLIRSVLFLLTRLAIYDTEAKSVLMRHTQLYSLLGGLMQKLPDKRDQQDFQHFLRFMGAGAPACKVTPTFIRTHLTSSRPSTSFKALKILAHSSIQLISIDHLFQLMHQPLTVKHDQSLTLFDKVLSLINQSPLDYPEANSPVPKGFRLQRHPTVPALYVPAETTWKSLLRSHAAYVLSHFIHWNEKMFMKQALLNIGPLVDSGMTLIRSVDEFDQWGGYKLIAALLHVMNSQHVHFKSVINEPLLMTICKNQLIRLMSVKTIDLKKDSIFRQDDLSWFLSTCCNILTILQLLISRHLEGHDEESQETYSLPAYCQNADISTAIVKTLHRISKDMAGLQHCGSDTTEMLCSLVYNCFGLLRILYDRDLSVRTLLHVEEHTDTLASYLSFADANVRRMSHSMLKDISADLTDHLKQIKRSKSPRKYYLFISKSMQLQPFMDKLTDALNTTATKYWPTDVFLLKERNGEFTMEHNSSALLTDHLYLKVCANSGCYQVETRRNLFSRCAKCSEDHFWFCSQACAAAHAQYHRTERIKKKNTNWMHQLSALLHQ